MRNLVIILVLVLGFVVAIWISSARSEKNQVDGANLDADRAVATVDGAPITFGEYLAALKMVPETMSGTLGTVAGRRSVVEEVARIRLLADRAREMGLDEDPEIRGRARLASERVLASEALAKILKQTEDEDLRRYYEEHLDRFTVVEARRIVLGFDGAALGPAKGGPRSKDEALALGNSLVDRLRAGEDFSGLARQFSDEPGPDPGESVSIVVARVPQPLNGTLLSLVPGETSDALETDYGVDIVQLVSRETRAFEEVRDGIAEQSLSERTERLLSDLVAGAKIEYQDDTLKGSSGSPESAIDLDDSGANRP